MKNNRIFGHILCLVTIIVWATTFISTKILLWAFSPVEIMFIRFLLGFCTLCVVCPRRFPKTSLRQELHMALTGLCGVTLYFLFENIALTYTTASNVAIIVSAAPFLTALLAHFAGQEKRLTPSFFFGFLFAISGIILITAADISTLHFNPFGDFLAMLAALMWAVYCVLMGKVNSYGFPVLLVTRKLFFYGLLCMIPVLYFKPLSLEAVHLKNPLFFGNLLYLGIGACAVCFVLWNYALQTLGAVTTNVYIYAQPMITVTASAFLLNESLTPAVLLGMLLTLTGLVISENKYSITELLSLIKSKKWRNTNDTI